MKKRKSCISTTNKEIYEKINKLHFIDEVIFRNTSARALSNVLQNINSESVTLIKERIGKIIVVKKIKPMNVNVYLR